jgi:hypothetical protein
MRPEITSRPGFIAWILGLILAVEASLTRLIFTADNDWVYIFGHPIHMVCAARAHFGIPCPTCGFTRGFVLSLHGDFAQAWRLSPSGPLFAIALLGAMLVCFAFAILQSRGMHARLPHFRTWVQAGALVYGLTGTIVWLATWVATVRRLS